VAALTLGVLCLAASLPLVVAVALLWKYRAFPPRSYALAALLGLVAVPPVALLQYVAAPIGVAPALLRAFLVVALLEEGIKFSILLGAFHLRSLKNAFSGFEKEAGLALGLGFALFESVVFLADDPSSVLMRVTLAAPLHGVCGAWIGLGVAQLRRMRLLGHRRPSAFPAFAVAWAAHGLYDLCLFLNLWPASLVIVAGLLVSLIPLFSERDRAA